MSKLRLVNLCKVYGNFTAVAETNLEVREGEFLSLLGPSGSGKTTLLMMVAGLLPPTSGEIWLDGRLATDTPPHRRDIGMVFQNYALFPHMTVAENVAFPLRMRRVPEAELRQRVHKALDMVQLAHLAHRYPAQLSGGQQQRVALARSLVYNPSVLLMDEPLGALDKKLREKMQLEIKQLHMQTGVTILYVTHDQEEALTMSDRICIMHGGRVEQIGSPAELYENPASEFVANFIGESNILPGRVVEARDEVLVTIDEQLTVRARHRPGLVPGQAVKVLIRPERFAELGDDPEGANRAAGWVEKAIYVGRLTRYWVRISERHSVIWEQSNLHRGPRFAQGDSVTLAWTPDNTIVLPA